VRPPRLKLRSLFVLVLFAAPVLTVIVQQIQIGRLHRQVAAGVNREQHFRRLADASAQRAMMEREIALRALQDAKAAAQANGGK
jgi:hypothetical protein